MFNTVSILLLFFFLLQVNVKKRKEKKHNIRTAVINKDFILPSIVVERKK